MPAPDLTFAKAILEEFMVDACTITEPQERDEDDPLDATGQPVPAVAAAVVYSGKCKITPRGPSGQTTASQISEGDRSLFALRYTVALPLTVTTVRQGHLITFTASQDPGLVGRGGAVIAPTFGTFRVARRIEVELREPQ